MSCLFTDVGNFFNGLVTQQGVADTEAGGSPIVAGATDPTICIEQQNGITNQITSSASSIASDVGNIWNWFIKILGEADIWNWFIKILGEAGIIILVLLVVLVFVYGFAKSR